MSKFVGTGPLSYKKRIYQAAVSQRLRNTDFEHVLWIQQYRLNVSAVFGFKILGCFNKNGILHNIKNFHTKCTLDEVKEWW